MFASAIDVWISARGVPVSTAIRPISVNVAREGAAAQQLAAVRMLGRQLGRELDDERLDLVIDLVAPGVPGPALQLHVDAGKLLVEGKAEHRRQAIEQLLRALRYERFGGSAAEPLRGGWFKLPCLLCHEPL